MRYYIIAGEPSGDLHAANLMLSLKQQDSEAEFRCWGGDKMEAAGGTIVKHYRDLAFMGFIEVVQNLRTILGNLKFCKQDILDWQPHLVILVDYPGFNLRIAKFLKQQAIPCYYYISPQVWAWKESRVKQIKRDVDRMFVILPFEKAFYKKHDRKVDFVGHPLLDELAKRKADENFKKRFNLDDRPIVALLPGSRQQEIKKMLPRLTMLASDYIQYQFVVGGLSQIPDELYSSLLAGLNVKLVKDATYDLLDNADAALVTSGTATLETALFNVPQIVCYKGSYISYYIARWLIKVDFIALVNLVMGREVVKELIQGELTEENMKREFDLLFDLGHRQAMESDYVELHDRLGGGGASAKTAELMIKYLRNL